MKRFGEVLTGARPVGGVAVLAATAVVAAGVCTVVLHTLRSDTALTDRQAIALSLAQGLALLLVARAPHLAWALSLGVVALSALWVGEGLWVDATLNSYLVVLGLASLLVTPRAAAGQWLGIVALSAVLAAVLRPSDWLSAAITVALLAGVVQIAGVSLGGLIATQASLREQRAATRRERERTALLEERARIARELHDVVAHHMSIIAIQAEAARHREPDTMPDTLASIRSSAVTAMGEMRRILEVLRSGDTGVSPQPGIDDLTALVEAVRATGTRVEIELPSSAPQLSPAVGLTVYRLVQEALSNAVRHAPGAPVCIRITRNGTDLGVTVDNPSGRGAVDNLSGRGAVDIPSGKGAVDIPSDCDLVDNPSNSGSVDNPVHRGAVEPGHGLTGMRERAMALGGTFDAGLTGDGSFRVTATLPVEVGR
ncbi:histidine kinase [Nocardia sp. NPDC051832]|uniref:sensor histidine kinase n=1 Tax=Nocardia sp. NPDC051832 TaxID=3155673 RepID=UPI0034459702